MKILFLDLASHSGLIACVTDKAVVASLEADHRISDAELIPAIEKLLKEAGWSYQDLTQIACVTGPGGFTSLRVAVAYANVLSDQLKIPSAGIHLSDLYFARAKGKDVVWVHSTKKEELFIRGGEWKEPTLVHLKEIASLPPTLNRVGEVIPEQRGVFSKLQEGELRDLSVLLPLYLPTLVYQRETISPWYGRTW